MNCPICNKVGLINTSTVCPQCNSDLVGFHTLKNASSKHNEVTEKLSEIENNLILKKVQNRQILTLGSIVLLGISLYIFWSRTKSNNQIDFLTKKIIQNQDSLLVVNQRFSNFIEENKRFSTIKYIVRKGDDLAGIAEFYYNDYHKYNMIMKENNMLSPIINVGDTLNIKITKQ